MSRAIPGTFVVAIAGSFRASHYLPYTVPDVNFDEKSLRTLYVNGGRIIAIGDVHGCFDELSDLLSRIAPNRGDTVVSVGDMVRKGPDPVRCLELWRDRGYHAVTGNNEEKVLRFASTRLRRLFLAREDRQVLGRRDLLDFIASWPALIDFPREQVTIVHGGFLPGMSVEDAARNPADVVSLRYIRNEDGRWRRVPKGKERDSDVLWSDVYRGERTVVYGHTPLDAPRIDAAAIGLDTGCVYGGELTAAIWSGGQWRFESVKAKRAYAKR